MMTEILQTQARRPPEPVPALPRNKVPAIACTDRRVQGSTPLTLTLMPFFNNLLCSSIRKSKKTGHNAKNSLRH
jgi:hypothetical protein